MSAPQSPGGIRGVFGAIDLAVFKLERALLVVSLSMMTLLVSVDVVQRTFSRPVGKSAELLLMFTSASTSAQTRVFLGEQLAPVLFWLLALGLFIFGAHASRSFSAAAAKAPEPKLPGSIGLGAAVCLAAWAFVNAVLWVFPSSVPGAQKFALGFMLWASMLGASLATRARRHIVIDTLTKKLDERTGRLFALLGGLTTAGFTGLLFVLGMIQFVGEVRDWAEGDGVGIYQALPLPIWISTLAIPFAFGVMAARFLAIGIHDFAWGAPKGGVDAHGLDMEALAKEPIDGQAPP